MTFKIITNLRIFKGIHYKLIVAKVACDRRREMYT